MGNKPISAPALLKKLLGYTPRHLRDPQASPNPCEHVYSTSAERSILPSLDERPGERKIWEIQTICQKCCAHLALLVDSSASQQPCPCNESPLHIFAFVDQGDDETSHFLRFQCIVPKCQARLHTQYRAPTLTSHDIWLLTDEVGLRQRFKDVVARGEPEPYTATRALVTFKSYIRDSIDSETSKRIPTENKRFKLALGNDASELLQRLGFTWEPPETETAYAHWQLPGPGPFLKQAHKQRLQDVRDELTNLVQQRPEAEKLKANEVSYRPPPATKDLERVLGCLDYVKDPAAASGFQIHSAQLERAFTALGAVPDFSDQLVKICFDRQIIHDPDNRPALFQSLRDITAVRGSEELVAKVSLLESQGFVGLTEIRDAYLYFGLDDETQVSVSDERLLDMYRSRLPDLGREEQARMNKALSTIASARGSDLLKDATNDAFVPCVSLHMARLKIKFRRDYGRWRALPPLDYDGVPGAAPSPPESDDAEPQNGTVPSTESDHVADPDDIVPSAESNNAGQHGDIVRSVEKDDTHIRAGVGPIMRKEDAKRHDDVFPSVESDYTDIQPVTNVLEDYDTDELLAEMETVAQAYKFLGVTESTDPDYIRSVAVQKTDESDLHAKLASKALELIGRARNNEFLRMAAHSGVGESPEALQHAYSFFGLQDNHQASDDMVADQHRLYLNEQPERAIHANEALSIIAQHRNSDYLRTVLSSLSNNAVHVSSGAGFGSIRPSNESIEEPRGLNNIGNTCYLNSLLQYLYTIKPIRDMVIDFEHYKQSLPDDRKPFVKRVADMKVDRAGVLRTQAFMRELAKLFEKMKNTRATDITPDLELVKMALEKTIPATGEETKDPTSPLAQDRHRRRSTLSGPGGPPERTRTESSSNVVGSPICERREASITDPPGSPKKKQRTDSSVSTATTVVMEEDASHNINGDLTKVMSPEVLAEGEAVKQANANGEMDIDLSQPGLSEQTSGHVPIPSANEGDAAEMQPPPVPPRPTTKAQVEEWVQQQDVSEVLTNVLHQLQWAIKPDRITQLGNQEDVVSDTFWGLSTIVATSNTGAIRRETTDFNAFYGRIYEPCNIYEALSNDLDERSEGERTEYVSIDKAPPVMQFELPRVTWDFERQATIRNADQCKLFPSIYLDRFMRNDETLRKRQLYWKYRDELKQRKSAREELRSPKQDQTMGQDLVSASKHLNDMNQHRQDLGIDAAFDDSELHETLSVESDHADRELQRLDHEIAEFQDRADGVFSKEQGQYKYNLQAIFVHRGSAQAGHWFTYMYDAHGDKWREYNDETITVVDPSKLNEIVYSADEVARGTSAFVVYVRADQHQQLFEPVHRDPEPEPEPQPSAAWSNGAGGQGPVRSQMSEMPPANVPYEGASQWEDGLDWDVNREVADSSVRW